MKSIFGRKLQRRMPLNKFVFALIVWLLTANTYAQGQGGGEFFEKLLARWQQSTLQLDALHKSLALAQAAQDKATQAFGRAQSSATLVQLAAASFRLEDSKLKVNVLSLQIAQLGKHRNLLRKEVEQARKVARHAEAQAAIQRAEESRANSLGLSLAQMRKQEKAAADRLLTNLAVLLELLKPSTNKNPPTLTNLANNQSNANQPTPNPSATNKRGTIIKADPAQAFGLSSTAASNQGINALCPDVEPWSLSAAAGFIGAASAATVGFSGDCRAANWPVCQGISDNLHEARDHIFQVFDQNHDGIANCRLCNYDAVLTAAHQLIGWENWLSSRYFYGSNGLSTIYYTIQDNADDPLCQLNSPATPSARSSASSSATTASSSAPSTALPPGTAHACADPNIPIDAHWKFYRYIYGGGGTAYAEKAGFICYTNTSYYTYQGQMEKFVCASSAMENCQPDASPVTVYTDIRADGDTTRYEYEGGYATRTSTDGVSTGAGTGTGARTNNQGKQSADDAVELAATACSGVDIESGPAWRFAANFGYSTYYEHNGYLCTTSTDTVLRIEGNNLVGYRCLSNWQSCAAAATYNAELVIDSTRTEELNGKSYTPAQIIWSGMQPRDLWIPK